MDLLDYVDKNDLNDLFMAGLISARMHPEAPLTILNYTPKAQSDGDWSNETLRKCRGLIYNFDTLKVVATPWEKFFNYGDPHTGDLSKMSEVPVTVTDKMDGSLGILYHTPDGRKWVATRGSFTSDQAIHATKWLRTNMPDFDWKSWVTPLVEIIYPENRIVLNYGNKDALVLIGGTYTTLGDSVIYLSPDEAYSILEWKGEVTETFEAKTLAEALALPPRENAEGIVVEFDGSRTKVKIKQDDYLRLHRVLYSLSNKAIWEKMVASETCSCDFEQGILDLLPKEVLWWIAEVEDTYSWEAWNVYDQAMKHLERYEYLNQSVADPNQYFKTVALSTKDLDPTLRSAVLMQMRYGWDKYTAMRKILHWMGYGTFQRPQNVNDEEE